MNQQLMVATWLADLGLGHLADMFQRAGFESLVLISQITFEDLQLNGLDQNVITKLIPGIGRLRKDLSVQEHEHKQDVATTNVAGYIRGLELLCEEEVPELVSRLKAVGADSL